MSEILRAIYPRALWPISMSPILFIEHTICCTGEGEAVGLIRVKCYCILFEVVSFGRKRKLPRSDNTPTWTLDYTIVKTRVDDELYIHLLKLFTMRHHRAAAHEQKPKIYASNACNVEEEKEVQGSCRKCSPFEHATGYDLFACSVVD